MGTLFGAFEAERKPAKIRYIHRSSCLSAEYPILYEHTRYPATGAGFTLRRVVTNLAGRATLLLRANIARANRFATHFGSQQEG